MADTGPRGPQGPAGTSIDLPVAIADGGTGATTRAAALRGLTELTSKLGADSDWDTTINAGVYQVGGLGNGAPEGAYSYGLLIVFIAKETILQAYIPDYLDVYIRQSWDSGATWRNWRTIAATAIEAN